MPQKRWCGLIALLLLSTLLMIIVGNVPSSISKKGENLLKLLEGFSGSSYTGVDSQNLTIGYGHVINSEELFEDELTEKEAAKLLKKDLQKYSTALHNFAVNNKIKLSQNQYDALIIFSYQLGPYIWEYEDYDFIQLLKSKTWTNEQIIYEMGRFDISEQIAYEGLWKRRMNEALLFIYGEYHLYELEELEEIGYIWPKKDSLK